MSLREQLTRFGVEWDNERWERTDREYRDWYRERFADVVLSLPGPDHLVVALPREDVDFIRGFHPDRDRTATRADLVRVIEHLQAALNDTEEGS